MSVPPTAQLLEIYALLGTWRIGSRGRVLQVLIRRGDPIAPAAGTLAYEIAHPSSPVPVRLVEAYYPVQVEGYPVRAAVLPGQLAAFPAPESALMITAGVASAL